MDFRFAASTFKPSSSNACSALQEVRAEQKVAFRALAFLHTQGLGAFNDRTSHTQTADHGVSNVSKPPSSPELARLSLYLMCSGLVLIS